MEKTDIDLVQQIQQIEMEHLLKNPPPPLPPLERPTIHWTALPEPDPGSRLGEEWNLYRREVGRLLSEGHEGKWLLIKGAEIVGIWETEQEANQVRLQRFLKQDVLM